MINSRESMSTLAAERGTYLIPSGESFPLAEDINAVSLLDFLADMQTL